jgi:hypothetical protein
MFADTAASTPATLSSITQHLAGETPIRSDDKRNRSGAAWRAVVVYALQIYDDFSGCADMAIGVGRRLGFRLPVNFRQPYRSLNISEFRRRWYISLSGCLRDSLYISLGKSPCLQSRGFSAKAEEGTLPGGRVREVPAVQECGSRISTRPRSPSRRMRWPVRSRRVASPVLSTAGSPYSRATTAPCETALPTSVTSPARIAK